MEKEISKYLVVDASGLDPIRYSIKSGWMKMEDINKFLESGKIQICITNSALQCGEFSYSETPDLFTHNIINSGTNSSVYIKDEKVLKRGISFWLTSNGTITLDQSLSKNGLEFSVFNTTSGTLSDCSKLSVPDKSAISLARYLLNIKKTAILVHDKKIRKQARCKKISFYGSASFLAGMAISRIYAYQKATRLYYKWKNQDKRWIPNKMNFKEVLGIEKLRFQKGESFWL
ncbi:MAG: hypothetical protein V1804_00885 [Patescibacteria group bacterium]